MCRAESSRHVLLGNCAHPGEKQGAPVFWGGCWMLCLCTDQFLLCPDSMPRWQWNQKYNEVMKPTFFFCYIFGLYIWNNLQRQQLLPFVFWIMVCHYLQMFYCCLILNKSSPFRKVALPLNWSSARFDFCGFVPVWQSSLGLDVPLGSAIHIFIPPEAK